MQMRRQNNANNAIIVIFVLANKNLIALYYNLLLNKLTPKQLPYLQIIILITNMFNYLFIKF